METREWVSFVDATGHTWRFDLSFMLSAYECQFGKGMCPGAFGNGNSGCCDIGFTFDAEELPEIQRKVEQLHPGVWDHMDKWDGKKWWVKRKGEESLNSKLVDENGDRIKDDAEGVRTSCVFAGADGCAFHARAVELGEDPINWKPDTCWQVPILCDGDEDETIIRPMQNLDWGQGEHTPLKYWCIEDETAYTGALPVFISLKAELQQVVGAAVYEELARFCKKVMEQGWIGNAWPEHYTPVTIRSRPEKPLVRKESK